VIITETNTLPKRNTFRGLSSLYLRVPALRIKRLTSYVTQQY